MDGGYNFGCGDSDGSGWSPWLGSTEDCDGAAQYVNQNVPHTIKQVRRLMSSAASSRRITRLRARSNAGGGRRPSPLSSRARAARGRREGPLPRRATSSCSSVVRCRHESSEGRGRQSLSCVISLRSSGMILFGLSSFSSFITSSSQVYSGEGGDICTGGRFNDGCGDGPAKEAYQIWTNYGCRWSWDPITVYLAVMGDDSLYSSTQASFLSDDAAGVGISAPRNTHNFASIAPPRRTEAGVSVPETHPRLHRRPPPLAEAGRQMIRPRNTTLASRCPSPLTTEAMAIILTWCVRRDRRSR